MKWIWKKAVSNPLAAGALLCLLVLAWALWALVSMSPETMSDGAIFLGRLHPLIVHLPIGFLIAAFLLEVLGRFSRFSRLQEAVSFMLLIGVVSSLAAGVAGYLLALSGSYDASLIRQHKWLGIGVFFAALAALALKQWTFKKPTTAIRRSYEAVLAVMMVLLMLTGHMGGSLTHGTQYLTEYMPQVIRTALAIAPRNQDTAIENVNEAALYHDLVRPVLENKCVSCHGASRQQGRLRLDSPEAIRQGGSSGVVVVPGDARTSALITRVWLPPDHRDHMPPMGHQPLTVLEAELIRWWIDAGASFEQTVQEVEASPIVQVMLDQIAEANMRNPAGLPDVRVSAAREADIDQVRAMGISVQPIVEGSEFIQVSSGAAATRFRDEELRTLRNLAHQIAWLNVSGTRITDDGLAQVSRFRNLTRLNLSRTVITDAGLQHLRGLEHLAHLNLYGTQVTDAGLEALSGMQNLRLLYLWQTGVTAEGVERLRQRLPDLQVDMGFDTLEPALIPAPDTTTTIAASEAEGM